MTRDPVFLSTAIVNFVKMRMHEANTNGQGLVPVHRGHNLLCIGLCYFNGIACRKNQGNPTI